MSTHEGVLSFFIRRLHGGYMLLRSFFDASPAWLLLSFSIRRLLQFATLPPLPICTRYQIGIFLRRRIETSRWLILSCIKLLSTPIFAITSTTSLDLV